MGAKYRPDWCPEATHLICAISNTDKYKDAKDSKAYIVTKDWIYDCSRKKKKLKENSYEYGKPKKDVVDSLVAKKGKKGKDPFLTDSEEEFSLHSSDEEFIDDVDDPVLDSSAEFDPAELDSGISQDNVIEEEDSFSSDDTEDLSDSVGPVPRKRKMDMDSPSPRPTKKTGRVENSFPESIDFADNDSTQPIDDYESTQPLEELKSPKTPIDSSFESSQTDDATLKEIQKFLSSKLDSPSNTLKEIFKLAIQCVENGDPLELYDLWNYKFPVFSKMRKLFKKDFPKDVFISKLKKLEKFYQSQIPAQEQEAIDLPKLSLPNFLRDEIFFIDESVPISQKHSLVKLIYTYDGETTFDSEKATKVLVDKEKKENNEISYEWIFNCHKKQKKILY
jgi:hypothetical protein